MNTPERISKLSAAILDMAEQNRGLIKSELEELIFQHCAASEMESKMPTKSIMDEFLLSAESALAIREARRDMITYGTSFLQVDDQGKWTCLDPRDFDRITDP